MCQETPAASNPSSSCKELELCRENSLIWKLCQWTHTNSLVQFDRFKASSNKCHTTSYILKKKGGQTFPDTVYSSHEAIGREISSAPTPTEDIWISQRPHYRPPCHEKVHLGGSLQPLLQLVLCWVSPGYCLCVPKKRVTGIIISITFVVAAIVLI